MVFHSKLSHHNRILVYTGSAQNVSADRLSDKSLEIPTDILWLYSVKQ